MYSLLVLAVISFFVCVAITPAVRRLAFRFGAVDQPDLSRKVHRQPTARIGGVSIMISYLAALGSLLLLPLRGSAALQYQPPIYELLPGVIIIFGVGLADDIFGLKPWHKLLAEAIAASYAYFAGVHVLGFSNHLVGGWLSFILTLGWLLLCTNAFNLIDGIDGLAAGAALVATLTMLIAAKFGDNYGLALATAPLSGSLCGILVYNFNPASIFLGDCGSLTLGYLLGCCGLIWSQKPATLLGMTAPVVVLGLPLLDTTLTIVRRFVGRRPLFIADRSHIHHRLLERGLTPRRVTVLLYGACAVAAALLASRQGRYPGAGHRRVLRSRVVGYKPPEVHRTRGRPQGPVSKAAPHSGRRNVGRRLRTRDVVGLQSRRVLEANSKGL